MGEIVAAKYLLRERVLLVGQAPGTDGDTRPLTGTMGLKLAQLSGLSDERFSGRCARVGLAPDERVGLFWDRANLLDFYPGPAQKGHAFPTGHARAAAAEMWPELAFYDRVLFCGKAVFEAFRTCEYGDVDARRRAWSGMTYFEWRPSTVWITEVAFMPHTSGIVTWWNDKQNTASARMFLQRLARDTTMSAVA